MSRFYGSIRGIARTEATRRGNKQIAGHIRGWDIGVRVEMSIDENGKDRITVYGTGGSNNPDRQIRLASFTDFQEALTSR